MELAVSGLKFTLGIDEDPRLNLRDTEANAVLEISSRFTTDGPRPQGTERCEVIVVDCSGSMSLSAGPPHRLSRIEEASRALRAAIDVLPDGVRFAVVEGTHTTRMIYPRTPSLAVADDRTREEARVRSARLLAEGGTNMGTWLARVRELFAPYPSALRHAIVLTDGENNDPPAVFDAALAACVGEFVCDTRGIGTGWRATELHRIAATLHGSADAVEGDLEAQFLELIERALGKVTRELRIRISTTPPAKIISFHQVYPTHADLTEQAVVRDERVTEFATGSWGEESRHYQVRLAVDSRDAPHAEDLRIARVDLLVDDEPRTPPGAVHVHWVADSDWSSQLAPEASHYTAQENMSIAVDNGIAALADDDRAKAVAELTRALRLAVATKNEKVAAMLRRILEIDPATGEVIGLRAGAGDPDLERVKIATSHFSLLRTAEPEDVPVAGPPWTCVCSRRCPAGDAFCVNCGQPRPPA